MTAKKDNSLSWYEELEAERAAKQRYRLEAPYPLEPERYVVVETPTQYGFYVNDNLRGTWSKDFYDPEGTAPQRIIDEAWHNRFMQKSRNRGYEKMKASRLPDSLVPVEMEPVNLEPAET